MKITKIRALAIVGFFVVAMFATPILSANVNNDILNNGTSTYSLNVPKNVNDATNSAIGDYLNSFEYGKDYGDTDLAVQSSVKELKGDFYAGDDHTYMVRYTKKTLESSPSKTLANSSENAMVAYPGAILLGDSNLANNTPTSVNAYRSDLSMAVDLPMSSKGFTVNPTYANVSGAIHDKTVEWGKTGTEIGANFTYKFTEAKSSHQVSTELGFTAEQLAGLGIGLEWQSTGTETTYVVSYTQIYYVVSIDMTGKTDPGSLFSSETTVADLTNQGIGAHKMPVIVSSVTYGRTIMASITSSMYGDDVKVALEAAIKGTEEGLTVEQKEIVKNSTTSIVFYGGNIPSVMPTTLKEVNNLIKTDTKITSSNVDTAKPLSYTTKWIAGSQELALNKHTDEYYEKEVVQTHAITVTIDFQGIYEGEMSLEYQTFDGFDENGNYINLHTDVIYKGIYYQGHKESFTVTAKHTASMYLTVHGVATSGTPANHLKVEPFDSIKFYHGGTTCNQDFTLWVDGVEVPL